MATSPAQAVHDALETDGRITVAMGRVPEPLTFPCGSVWDSGVAAWEGDADSYEIRNSDQLVSVRLFGETHESVEAATRIAAAVVAAATLTVTGHDVTGVELTDVDPIGVDHDLDPNRTVFHRACTWLLWLSPTR